MKIIKAFLAIGYFLLIGIIDKFESLKEWWNSEIEVYTRNSHICVKRKYRILLWFNYIYACIMFLVIIYYLFIGVNNV